MWVFAYDSLMWQKWYKDYGCTAMVKNAFLNSYHREFNLASTMDYGTPATPAPILGLEPGDNCIGVAYEFPDANEHQVLETMKQRFPSTVIMRGRVNLPSAGKEVEASFAMPVKKKLESGGNYIGHIELQRRAEWAAIAHGSAGSAHDYLKKTVAGLRSLGIRDFHCEQILGMIDTYLNRPKTMIQLMNIPHEAMKSYHIRYNTEHVIALSPDLLGMLGAKSGETISIVGPKTKSGTRRTTRALAVGGKKGQLAMSSVARADAGINELWSNKLIQVRVGKGILEVA